MESTTLLYVTLPNDPQITNTSHVASSVMIESTLDHLIQPASTEDAEIISLSFLMIASFACCLCCCYLTGKRLRKPRRPRHRECVSVLAAHNKDARQYISPIENDDDDHASIADIHGRNLSAPSRSSYRSKSHAFHLRSTVGETVIEYESDIYEAAKVKSWLESKVGLPQYYNALISNGYESVAIIREIEQDPSLLQAIGITRVDHQKRFLKCIGQLNIIGDLVIDMSPLQEHPDEDPCNGNICNVKKKSVAILSMIEGGEDKYNRQNITITKQRLDSEASSDESETMDGVTPSALDDTNDLYAPGNRNTAS